MCTRLPLLLLSGLFLISAPAVAQNQPISMPEKDFEALRTCASTSGQPQIDACNDYLAKYPGSSGVQPALEILLTAYDQANDPVHVLATADKLLAIDHDNLRALAFESSLRIQAVDLLSDPRAKREEAARAVRYARAGLAAEKPATMSAAEWDELRDRTRPVFQAALSRARLLGLS